MIKLGNNNIGKIYFGSNLIGKAYLGSNLVYQSGASPTPPTPTIIPYIRGGADGSYIDTGITADNTVKVIVWARNFNPGTGFLFGSREAAAVNTFCVGAHPAQNTGRIRIDYAQTNTTFADDQFVNLSHYHKYELYDGVFKVDDVTIASATPESFSNSSNIHLFGVNTNGTHLNLDLPIDICACKIYKNDVLVRDFTATNSPSAGLYDAVSETIFTNAGSGSFTYGTFYKDAYTALEYISGSGGQYFDTGLKGGYSIPWTMVYTPTGSAAGFTYPLGAQTSSSSGRCEMGIGNSTYVNGRLYFNYQGTSNNVKSTNTNNYFTNKKIVYLKNNNTATAYIGTTQEGTVTGTAGATFETDYNLYFGTLNQAGSAYPNMCVGKFHYCYLGSKNFVPAKVNNAAGMYDTYNDIFYPSISGTPFIAGPTIQ